MSRHNGETFQQKKMDHLSKGSRVEKDMARLGDVRCVQVVVVLDLLQVVVLQGHQEVDQGPPRDTERSRDIPILEASNRNGTAIKLACSPVLMLGRICGWISDLNS